MTAIMEDYYCWPEGLSEGDAKVVKADSPKEAAKLAMDSWRHEGSMDHSLPRVTVNVKDSNNEIVKVFVSQERFLDSSGPNV
jgi:hypothetical protein